MDDAGTDSRGHSDVFTPEEAPVTNDLVAEHLRSMPSIYSRGLIYLTVSALLCGFLYSLLGQVDLVTECRGVATPGVHEIQVFSDRAGFVEELYVQEGQLLEAGAPILKIRTTTRISKSLSSGGVYYDAQILSFSTERERIRKAHDNRLSIAKLRLEQNGLLLESLASEIEFWQREIDFLGGILPNGQGSDQDSAGPATAYEPSNRARERARMQLQGLRSRREMAINEKEILSEELKEEEQDFNSQELFLENQIAALREQKEVDTRRQAPIEVQSVGDAPFSDTEFTGAPMEIAGVIKTPHGGTVSGLNITKVGEYVRESDLVCTLLPAEYPLHVDLTVTNRDIGFIETGMEIRYKFDAFSYADYGVLSGKVIAIAPSATEHPTLGLVYHVRGTLDLPYFEIQGKRHPLKPGMTATAELVTGKSRIISLLVRRLKG